MKILTNPFDRPANPHAYGVGLQSQRVTDFIPVTVFQHQIDSMGIFPRKLRTDLL